MPAQRATRTRRWSATLSDRALDAHLEPWQHDEVRRYNMLHGESSSSEEEHSEDDDEGDGHET